MTTQTTGEVNGRTRKSLASQIDRLDGILDGLSEGLNDAVATVVKEAVGIAVRETVQAVFAEVLTNPALLARLQPKVQQASTPPKVTFSQRLAMLGKGILNQCQWLGQKVKKGCCNLLSWVGSLWQNTCKSVRTAASNLRILVLFKYQLLVAMFIGIATGFGAYYLNPWLAVAVSGVAGFATGLAAQLVMWLRRMFENFSVADLQPPDYQTAEGWSGNYSR